jgi:hypothetical protein
MFPEYEAKLQEMRKEIVENRRVATVLGFGPRFLHSTGQAYKGGPNSGIFLQITCDESEDLAIPQRKYVFGIVKAAQARGDFQVFTERHRRAFENPFRIGSLEGHRQAAKPDFCCGSALGLECRPSGFLILVASSSRASKQQFWRDRLRAWPVTVRFEK